MKFPKLPQVIIAEGIVNAIQQGQQGDALADLLEADATQGQRLVAVAGVATNADELLATLQASDRTAAILKQVDAARLNQFVTQFITRCAILFKARQDRERRELEAQQ